MTEVAQPQQPQQAKGKKKGAKEEGE